MRSSTTSAPRSPPSARRGPRPGSSFAAISRDPRTGIWISLVERASALAAAERVDAAHAAGEPVPLRGRTFAVKDNIDVAGIDTTAGCPAFAYRPAASAASVQRLVDAGAVVIGKTNLDQFATGLVGTRSPYGVCPNAHWPELVSGGSSSGSAVAVAAGHVDFSLGTDTAGSGRVPAMCNGIIGIKPTRGSVSAHGVVPACRSLDCVSVFARELDLAATVAGVLATTAPDPADPWSRSVPRPANDPYAAGTRVGVAALDVDGFDGDRAAQARFADAGAQISARGFAVEQVDIAAFVQAGALLYEGAFVAERYEAVGEFVAKHLDDVDPVVGPIVLASAGLPAWQVFRDRTRLHELAVVTAPVWDQIDVLVVPTAPRVPTVAEVAASPIERNTMLGRYTNFVNLLDLCALTLPLPVAADDPHGPPTSVTLLAPAGADELLVSVARRLCETPPSPRMP
jgi:allophanate hydrolase